MELSWSVISDQWSVISDQWSVISDQWSDQMMMEWVYGFSRLVVAKSQAAWRVDTLHIFFFLDAPVPVMFINYRPPVFEKLYLDFTVWMEFPMKKQQISETK